MRSLLRTLLSNYMAYIASTPLAPISVDEVFASIYTEISTNYYYPTTTTYY